MAKASTPEAVRFPAELTGVTLKKGTREFHLKIKNADMRRGFASLYVTHQTFEMQISIPVEKKKKQIVKWRDVRFPTMLSKVTLNPDGLAVDGRITTEAVTDLADLVQNWSEGMEVSIYGVQPTLFA